MSKSLLQKKFINPGRILCHKWNRRRCKGQYTLLNINYIEKIKGFIYGNNNNLTCKIYTNCIYCICYLYTMFRGRYLHAKYHFKQFQTPIYEQIKSIELRLREDATDHKSKNYYKKFKQTVVELYCLRRYFFGNRT